MDKKLIFDWEEIDIFSEDLENKSNDLSKNDGFHSEYNKIKSNLRETLSIFWDLNFEPEKLIDTNLSGTIYLKTGGEYPDTLSEGIEDILNFYERKFQKDDEILYFITYSLLKLNRTQELVHFLQIYLANEKIPLDLEIFFITAGILSTDLPNIILSGEEKNIINILYKFRFYSISKSEKNFLYDEVISDRNPGLTGLVFHLFFDTYHGIRNIYPIYEIIIKNFDDYSLEDKKEFLLSFNETGKYLNIYFFQKKICNKAELDNWLQLTKIKNGKIKNINDISLKDDSMELVEKYSKLSKIDRLDLLSPFEIITLLKDNSKNAELKNNLFKALDKNFHSYSLNLSLSVIYFFEREYSKFLLYSERSGSLKNYSEILYLRALCYREIGYNIEASKILDILNSKFPNIEFIKDSH